jgi:hypothetical protein
MKRVWGAALCAVIVAGIAGVSTTAVAQSSGEQPKATDVGITDKEIHIAVIADVDSPLAPNLFVSSRDAVQGGGCDGGVDRCRSAQGVAHCSRD